MAASPRELRASKKRCGCGCVFRVMTAAGSARSVLGAGAAGSAADTLAAGEEAGTAGDGAAAAEARTVAGGGVRSSAADAQRGNSASITTQAIASFILPISLPN